MLPGVLLQGLRDVMWIRTGTLTGSFNVNFLKLSAAEKKKNIELAKVVPFAATNVNLKRYEFADADRRPGTVWQLLMAIRECGLKKRCSYGQLL